jgi:protein gp37
MTHRLEAMGKAKYAGLTVLNPKGDRHFNGQVRTHADALTIPLAWKKPRRVFVNSMSDLFHKDVPFEFIAAVYGVMDACGVTEWGKPNAGGHTFQILTKRPERAVEFHQWLDQVSAETEPRGPRWTRQASFCNRMACARIYDLNLGTTMALASGKWPLKNVWLGTSIEDQKSADERIPELLKCPAAGRFLSCEPLLGPVDLPWIRYAVEIMGPDNRVHYVRPVGHPDLDEGRRTPGYWLHATGEIDWVIVGGESGPGARPMHPDWARSIRDQCQAAGVAFFFNQWGEFETAANAPAGQDWSVIDIHGQKVPIFPSESNAEPFACVRRVGKKVAGRLLDGREWNEMPQISGQSAVSRGQSLSPKP